MVYNYFMNCSSNRAAHYCYRRRLAKDTPAVSPVVATMLLVAITVILVGVLFVWIHGMIRTPKVSTPTATYEIVRLEGKGQIHIAIRDVRGRAPSIADVRYSLHDAAEGLLSKGKLTQIYQTTLTPAKHEVVFIDHPDADTKLNADDYFIVNMTDAIGGSFVLIYRHTDEHIMKASPL